jgi:hypothetical protein
LFLPLIRAPGGALAFRLLWLMAPSVYSSSLTDFSALGNANQARPGDW